MTEAFTGAVSAISGLVGVGGQLFQATRDAPEQQFTSRPPFRGTITTPAFTFGGGTIKRTGTDAFSFPGCASSLEGVRSGLSGL